MIFFSALLGPTLSACMSTQYASPEAFAEALKEGGVFCSTLDSAGSAEYQFARCTDDSGGWVEFSLWESRGNLEAAWTREFEGEPLSRCIGASSEVLVGSNWTAYVSFSRYSLGDLKSVVGGEIKSREEICRKYRE